MAPSLSGRGYAKHRGVSEAAVRKAIKSERLTREGGSILPDGSIDAIAADREWAAKTDTTKPLNSLTGNPKHRKDPSGASVPIGVQGDEKQASGARAPLAAGIRLMESKALKEDALAQQERLKLAELVGQLVRADEVKIAVTNKAQRVRDHILAIPEQIAARLAAAGSPAEISRILNDELRRCLSELPNSSHIPTGAPH